MPQLSAEPAPALEDADRRGIVRLLGDVVAARQDFAGVKRHLAEGICRLVAADAWTWSLGCAAGPGELPFCLGMAHGGFDEARYARLLLAAGHPGLAGSSGRLLGEMRQGGGHLTRSRQQIVDEAAFAASGADARLDAADVGPFLLSLWPIDERAVSAVGIFWRRRDPPFSDRDCRIAHLVLSELPWLHEQGWPADRGASLARLSPRLRLVLNLLLDGRSRKEMAASLSLSEHTIAQYRKAIYGHFGVRSQSALMRRFRMGGEAER